MIKKNIILLISIMIFGLLINCSDDDEKENECISSKTEYVTSVNSPTTGEVNETINIKVNFQVFNGCGRFGKFITSNAGDYELNFKSSPIEFITTNLTIN